MQTERYEALKQQHRFAEWRGKSEFDRPLRGFELRGDEWEGWRLARRDARPDARPPRTTIMIARDVDELIRVDVLESESVASAHEELIRALGEFEAFSLARQGEPVAGDVAFAVGTSLVFARGNLVVVVRNGGRKLVDTAAPARTLDGRLVERLRALKR